MAIPRVQLTKFYRNAIHCPFCGQEVLLRLEKAQLTNVAAICKHTLFVCDEWQFEFRSGRFNENLGLIAVKDEDILVPESAGYDSLTNLVTICDAVKFALYAPGPPLVVGKYVGFAPVEGEERMDD